MRRRTRGHSRPGRLQLALTTMLAWASAASADDAAVTLPQAYVSAAKNSPTVAIMQARLTAADAERKRAWSALKPLANFRGTFTHNQVEAKLDFDAFLPPGSGVETEEVVIQQRNQFGFDLEARLPIIRPAAYPRLGQSKATLGEARLRLLRSQQDYLLRVARVYYNAINREQAISALRNKVKLDQRNVQASRARLEVGRVMRSDVLRAELVLTQDEQQLKQQEYLFAAAKQELALISGLARIAKLQRPQTPKSPIAHVDGLLKQAVHRADIRADRLAVVAANKLMQSTQWRFAPTLDFSFLYRWQQAAGFAGRNGTYQLLLTLTLPLYDSSRYAELRSAEAQRAERDARLQAALLEMRRTVVRLRAELLSAESAVKSATKAKALAETTASDMLARYEAGTAIQLNVLDATQRLLDAELDLARSVRTRDLQRLTLAHAIGQFNPIRRASATE